MKKRILFFLLTIFGTSALSAQVTDFESLYRKYEGRSNFTTIEVSGDMISMMGNMTINRSGSGMPGGLEGVEVIRMVVATSPDAEFTSDMIAVSKAGGYSLMSSVSENGRNTRFYFKDKGGNERGNKRYASEFLLLMYGGSENLAINIQGRLDIQNITNLSGISIGGMNNFD